MSPKFWLALSVVILTVSSCTCGKGVIPVPGTCKGEQGLQAGKEAPCLTSAECGDHFNCLAPKDDASLLCCLNVDRKCTTEADCCPGQTCPTDRKKCFDKYLACEVDADCGEAGDRVCLAYSDTYGNSTRCRFKPCGALGVCPEGQACFQGECMAGLPCTGSCDSGKGCVIDTDRCQDYASPTGRKSAACPMTCNAGFIATFKDPTNIFDSCDLPKVQCLCAELPSLHSEDLGRFSAMAAQPGKGLAVSEYDGQYGDLVVARFDLTGAKIGTDYVDGVPASTVKFGPSGARGGVIEPGDDVGRYTDIASSPSGQLYVSYFDATHGDLKVAVRGTDGKWTNHKVDGDNAELGLYTSIGVDSDGLPGVSYFQRGGDATFDASSCPAPAPTGPKGFITALKYAHAKTPTPSSASDWTISTLACQSRLTPPCFSCASPNVCADPTTGPSCYAPATTCTGCDVNTQVCVTVAGTATCATKYNPANLTDIVDGVGLFSSIAFNGKDAYIGFMTRTTQPPMGATRFAPDGDLYAIKLTAGSPGAMVKLDGSGDTGYFPDVKIDPSTKSVAIGYHDFTSKKLKFYYSAQLQTGVTPEVIVTGAGAVGSGQSNWVGTDSSLIFGGSAGQIYAVYQDATTSDLKVAKRATTWQVQPSIHTAGAVGFFADGVFTDGKMFASHAKIHAKLIAGEPHVDNSLIVETVPGN